MKFDSSVAYIMFELYMQLQDHLLSLRGDMRIRRFQAFSPKRVQVLARVEREKALTVLQPPGRIRQVG